MNQNNDYNQPYLNQSNDPTTQQTIIQETPKSKKLRPITFIYPIIIIILIVILFITTGDNNYKKPIELYCEGLDKLDITIINKAFPKELINYQDNNVYKQIEEEKVHLATYSGEQTVTCDMSEGLELTKEELQELSDDFQYSFNTDRIISKAYYVNVNRMIYIKYEDKEPYTNSENIVVTVAKIEGKWYYIDEN